MSNDKPVEENNKLATRLPEQVTRRGIDEGQWNTLCRSLFPGANPNSVLLMWDYCKARGLDPMKKPCHIVPMEVRDAKTNQYEWRDVVMPGIYEYRTTAHRTGEYLGHSEPVYGPDNTFYGLIAPEWCDITVYRWNQKAQMKVPFPVRVFFSEVVATKRDRKTSETVVNARWTRAPKQMLTKCAEAAGIREAFPEEIGGEPTAEEMDGQRSVHTAEGVVEAEVEPVNPFEGVAEGLVENIEKGFEVLQMSDAQKLVKVHEYLANATDKDAAAEKLLEFLREEYTNKTFPKKKSDGDNGKKKAVAKPAAQASQPAKAEPVKPEEPPVEEPIQPIAESELF